jgi:hypothetical protein
MQNSARTTLLLLLVFATACAQPTRIPPHDKHITYEGRVMVTSDSATLIWPGTSVTIRFKGTAMSALLRDQDTSNYYNIILDGRVTGKLHTNKEKKEYTLGSNLSKGEHTLQLFKRTEWDKGTTTFYGFTSTTKTELLDPAPKPKRRIEFFGNSITCGYAIEDNVNDSPIGYFENNYDSYAALTARHFNAQYHCTSKSGIGIMISWFPLIMPEMYDRLDPVDSTSHWDFSAYTPDLVVVNLFQNDSWLVKQPKHEQFIHRFGTQAPDENRTVSAYKEFITTIRKKYPKAQIICMLGNMDITREGSPWPDYVQKAVSELHDNRIFTYFAPYKNTPGHPKTAEQKMLADGLIRFIDEHIRW